MSSKTTKVHTIKNQNKKNKQTTQEKEFAEAFYVPNASNKFLIREK